MTERNKGGRPPMNGPGQTKRAPINLRVTPALRARLDASAASNGLSLAQEIEQRIESSFDYADAAEYLSRNFEMKSIKGKRAGVKHTAEQVAEGLTGPQRECILAMRPDERRRATCFSGSVASNLCIAKGSRPALLTKGDEAEWSGHVVRTERRGCASPPNPAQLRRRNPMKHGPVITTRIPTAGTR